MKLFKISIGNIEKLAVGEDEADVYERRAEYDHTFDYLPVMIEEVTVEGYTITVNKNKERPTHDKMQLVNLNRDQLKAWLTVRNIEFTPQWGEEKLRELAIANV